MMTIQTSPVSPPLAALMQRAGASDKDREKWLAERRRGATATEIRDLVRGYLKAHDLIALKLGRKVDSFTGNRYTDWGKAREGVIAELLRGEGIDPESRVFHHADNDRYLASPDGIGITFDDELVVSEIKTAAHDLPPGSPEIEAKGYELQVQWVMFVTGAVRCVFVVEERVEEPDGSFSPGRLHRHVIERDEVMIERLRAVADDFLSELDRQAKDGPDDIDERLDTLAVNYLRALGDEKTAGAAKTAAFDAIKQHLAGHEEFVQESLLARVSWKRGGTKTEPVEETRAVVNVEAAQSARPAVWKRLEAAAAGVARAEAALTKAQERAEKAAEAWAGVTAKHSVEETVVVEKAVTVRQNLTVTAVTEKKQKEKVA